jgi:hypothetical protein
MDTFCFRMESLDSLIISLVEPPNTEIINGYSIQCQTYQLLYKKLHYILYIAREMVDLCYLALRCSEKKGGMEGAVHHDQTVSTPPHTGENTLRARALPTRRHVGSTPPRIGHGALQMQGKNDMACGDHAASYSGRLQEGKT